ncbi:hypothetical protein R3W88_004396 [Solanum pinnatisectum]|uniref:Transactivator protein n=1 Tax=Solanum pinnatisectum TaxID=50273 RepID=A0AAV9K958_9SOLN|nr:hypothetical protein R3W88_004396 [Solanum pinnatisectum]
MEQILNLLTTLCTKVDSMDGEIQQLKNQASSQQHDVKNAELRRSEDAKIPDLEGDVGKLHKTHNVCLNTAAGTSGVTKKEKATEEKSYNKLIALPGTNINLVTTCYNYGLLSTVYTATGDEISKIPELYKAFLTYKRITKGTLFFIKFYTATAEILYDEIKPVIQVIKIGLTRDMLIPEKIEKQDEIHIVDIPDFYANKRVIGIATILTELANNYLNNNTIWSYYSRDNTMIYSNCRGTREGDMEEIRQWILSLLKPENIPTTRAIRKNFISSALLTRYCTTISSKYSEYICSKCHGEDNNVPTVQLE